MKRNDVSRIPLLYVIRTHTATSQLQLKIVRKVQNRTQLLTYHWRENDLNDQSGLTFKNKLF